MLLLPGILLPMTLAPGWLRTLLDVNPLKHVVDGVRALFLGDVGQLRRRVGPRRHVSLVLAGVAVGTRTFQRESG